MKRILGIATLLSALCLSPMSVLALDFQQTYAGGSLAFFNLNTGLGGSDTVFGAYGQLGIDFGRYDFLGAELRLGTTDEAATAFSTAGTHHFILHGIDYFVSLLAKGHYRIARGARAYGLLGLSTVKTSTTTLQAGVITGTVSESDTSTDFGFGFGLDYRIQDVLLLAGEWVLYNSDASGFALNLKYEF